jgi:hypothetical protein
VIATRGVVRAGSGALALLLVAGVARGERTGGAERSEVGLGGALVALLAAEPGDRLYALVRPEGEVDGPRRLLAIERPPAARAELVAEGVGGWTKVLAGVASASGPELVAAGLARLAALGPLARPDGVERLRLEHPGFDLRSLAPERLRVGVESDLAAAEVGALRRFAPTPSGALEAVSEVALPFRVERRGAGLRLRGVPVVALAPDAAGRRRYAAGPEVATASRLRVVLLTEAANGDWIRDECWVALPAPEEVEESWIADGDDGPLLVVRTQGALEINAFENQLWRVYKLGPDRTRAGRRAVLAFTADSKRWHDSEVLIADGDGDGRRDLLIARPEGLTGSDLVVERYAGVAGGSFESRARRTDLDAAPSAARWLADLDGSGSPGLVTLTEDRLVAWRLAREGRRALERRSWLDVLIDRGDGERRARLEILGAAPRPDAAPDLLLLAVPEKGESRLILVRPPAR